MLIVLVFCIVCFFIFVLILCLMPTVARVFGLSFLDFLSGFSNIYLMVESPVVLHYTVTLRFQFDYIYVNN